MRTSATLILAAALASKPWKPADQQKFNALGAQGWELVQQLVGVNGTNGDVYFFKRQLP